MFERYDFELGYGGGPTGNEYDAVNGPLFEIKVPSFMCPSDATTPFISGGVRPLARWNYGPCFSPDGTMIDKDTNFTYQKSLILKYNPATSHALFNVNVERKSSDVVDGTSKTICFSERIAGTEYDVRGLWWYHQGAFYTHRRGPNSNIPDAVWASYPPVYCTSTPTNPCAQTSPGWGTTDYAARSLHPGGVHALRIDSSVNFYSDQIDLSLWQALASIDGDEVINSESF
jgi:hypothetical protein